MCQVSIVLPVYNGKDRILEAVNSIINQTYEDFELIIVDDCSNDGTDKVLKKIEETDKRVKVITNSKNLKLPSSLNVGFANAKGEFYTWTSDDNLFAPTAIKTMVEFLEKNKNYGMVYCNTILIDASGNEIRKNALPDAEEIIYKNTVGACFLYRSSIAKKVGVYDKSLFLAEDYDYWIRIYKESMIKHLEDYLYYYRIHEKSLSATRNRDVKLQTNRVWKKHFDFISEKSRNKREFCHFLDFYIEYSDDTSKCDELDKIKKKYIFYRRYLFWGKIRRILKRKKCVSEERK